MKVDGKALKKAKLKTFLYISNLHLYCDLHSNIHSDSLGIDLLYFVIHEKIVKRSSIKSRRLHVIHPMYGHGHI